MRSPEIEPLVPIPERKKEPKEAQSELWEDSIIIYIGIVFSQGRATRKGRGLYVGLVE